MSNQVAEMSNDINIPSRKDLKTLVGYFYQWEKKIPNQVFLRQPIKGQYKEYTWKEVDDQARRIATALQAMNLPEKCNIGIVSKNTAHWIMSDISIMIGGYVSVPFYATLDAEKLNEVLVHSECKVLFVGAIDDWAGMKDGIPDNMTVITFPDSPAEADKYLKWDDLIQKNEPLLGEPEPDLDDLLTIIYTSGTTGMPKGVMHRQYNFSYVLNATKHISKLEEGNNRFLSFLPLCHVAERIAIESACLFQGGTISFVESLDTFSKNLADTQPTHFFAVPRLWTKFKMGILNKMPESKLNLYLKIPILSGIVKNKIKKSLGLSKARIILTGAASMPSSLLDWYKKLGIIIQEAYGMTENVGICTSMRIDNIKKGTVGQTYPGCELKIEPITKEVLMKADWVMNGYFKDEEKTNETVKDGWLHTGDMGEIDSSGFLKITGRVKDQFKGAKGEFIVPAPIENDFAANNYVEQVCLVGRGLPQPVALIVLSEDGQKDDRSTVKETLEETRKSINTSLVSHEKVQKIVIVNQPWGIENNMLTPTLKIKRNVLEEVYGQRLEDWYETKDSIIFE